MSSAKDEVVPTKEKCLVDMKLAIAVPEGPRIAPRSGLAAKHMIQVGGGIVDVDYRDPVKVVLFDHGEWDFELKKGGHIAQLILAKINMQKAIQVRTLEDTEHEDKAFRSMGIKSRS